MSLSISSSMNSAAANLSAKDTPTNRRPTCTYYHLTSRPEVGEGEVLLCCSSCNGKNLVLGGLYTARVLNSNGTVVGDSMFIGVPRKLVDIFGHASFDRLTFEGLTSGTRTQFYSDNFGLHRLVLKRVD